MINLIENITKELVLSLDNSLSKKASQETISKIRSRISDEVERSLQEKDFIFEKKEDFLKFCESRLSFKTDEAFDDGYNGGMEIDIYLDGTIYLLYLLESRFYDLFSFNNYATNAPQPT